MRLRHRDRLSTVMLAAFAVSVTVGLAACGSTESSSTPTSPVSVPAATTVATLPAVASGETTPATTAAPSTTDAVATVSDADVADMEKQLDEIDQLLGGVDSDLSQD